MDYPIFLTQGEPRFDSLGVIKLCCTPETPIDERIFAQAQVGRTADLFYLRIWSFETSPAPDATVRAVLTYEGHSLTLRSTAAGDAALLLDQVPIEGQLTAYQISGEDLQGEYWGAVMMVSFDWLSQVLCLPQGVPVALCGNLLRENPAVSSAVPMGEALQLLLP